uniref:Uncharacterized protein n=1 Tax=Siphoviridae sp. ctRGj11 TaxID=2827868 RepID=A0A8S5SKC7_9CAUD|nr:MAG TPA: hypothetical protein [Siphoviridae sp. ctRGj11]
MRIAGRVESPDRFVHQSEPRSALGQEMIQRASPA